MIIMAVVAKEERELHLAVTDEQGIIGTRETWEKVKEAADRFYSKVSDVEIIRHNTNHLRYTKMLDQVSQDVIEGKVFGL